MDETRTGSLLRHAVPCVTFMHAGLHMLSARFNPLLFFNHVSFWHQHSSGVDAQHVTSCRNTCEQNFFFVISEHHTKSVPNCSAPIPENRAIAIMKLKTGCNMSHTRSMSRQYRQFWHTRGFILCFGTSQVPHRCSSNVARHSLPAFILESDAGTLSKHRLDSCSLVQALLSMRQRAWLARASFQESQGSVLWETGPALQTLNFPGHKIKRLKQFPLAFFTIQLDVCSKSTEGWSTD